MTTQLIYISGSGRSGSTLLERILHSAPSVTALGEFHCLWRLPQDRIMCACGTPFNQDVFWIQILRDAGIGKRELDELAALESSVCRTGYIARHRFSLAALRRQNDVRRFLAIQFAILDAVADVAVSPIIVDSSKAGPRAWLLACDPRVRFIHLYRDPADVIASWRSVKFDPGLGTAMARMRISAAVRDWWKVEQLMSKLCTVHDVVKLDYSRLCEAPELQIRNALHALGLTETVVPAWIGPATIEPGTGYHSLNGNPDRFTPGPIRISARSAGKSALPLHERFQIKAWSQALTRLHPRPTTDANF